MRHVKSNIAYIIGNAGLGDTITLIGMTNYLATLYEYVFLVTPDDKYENVKLFFDNPKIIVYQYKSKETNMFAFDEMMRMYENIYDIYTLGHFGSIKIDKFDKYLKMLPNGEVKKIIKDYPKSYYEDVGIPISVMTEYFYVSYDEKLLMDYEELFHKYPNYRVVHQDGSNAKIDIIKMFDIDIEEMLTIDVNRNLYPIGHKYYEISQKFINLPKITNYAKLLENASELYLMDSCIHALALIVNIEKAYPRICLKRTFQLNYGIPNKFVYYMIYTQN
jgi:hypothetical protein